MQLMLNFVLVFRRKEFRGKLAIAITANFVNGRTTAEAVVEEIRFEFKQKMDFMRFSLKHMQDRFLPSKLITVFFS
jgi:hypothetical protein